GVVHGHRAVPGGTGATGHLEDRRIAAGQLQRLAGQAGGRVARGNGDDEADGCGHGFAPRVPSRSSNEIQNASGRCAVTGTLKCRSPASAWHFTASFSVISTGRSLPNRRSCAV